MKHIRIIISSIIIFSISCLLYSQQSSSQQGTRFNFEKYIHSTENLYREINQSDIKAVKLAFKTISSDNAANSILFYTLNREGDKINLMELLFWAVKEKNLQVYQGWWSEDPFIYSKSLSEVEKTLTRRNSMTDTIINPDLSGVKSYLLIESLIYGKNSKIIETRPIGLCPVNTFVRMEGERTDTIKEMVFWVYFPDIMHLLSNHVPDARMKGIRTTLDFFVKNHYKGKINNAFHFNSYLMDEWIRGDHSSEFSDRFNVKWINDKINDGIFVNPEIKKYHGNNEKPDIECRETDQESELDTERIDCAKTVFETINLKDVANYPLYFPESPYFGQKSLIDVLIQGIRQGDIAAYLPDPDEYGSFIQITGQDVETAMGMEQIATTYNVSDREWRDTTYWKDIISSEVKEYILKRIEFYNNNGDLIDSRIVGLIPVRYYFDNQLEKWNRKQTFLVLFSDQGLRRQLSENYAYRFSMNDTLTYYSFFTKNHYKIDSIIRDLSSVEYALTECGISLEQPFHDPFGLDSIKDIDVKKLSIADREINRTDTLNCQLFYPSEPANGLISLFDLSLKAALNGYIAWYNERVFESDAEYVSYNDIMKRYDLAHIVYDQPGQPVLYYSRGSESIKKYIVKEMHIDSMSLPIAICPVRDESVSNVEGGLTLENAERFWIPLNASFRFALTRQEIIRQNCEPEKTFIEYLANNKYRGKIINEKRISSDEAERILKELAK